METKACEIPLYGFALRSYRTYEEWKHVFHTSTPHLFYSSYRTYEEWKPLHI